MAQTGHADDCPACLYDELTDTDRAGFDRAAFDAHIRVEPEAPPARPYIPACVTLAGMLGLPLSQAVQPWWGLSLALMFGAGIWWLLAEGHWRATGREWRVQHEAWKTVQTQVWLRRRAQGELWPCPTCGRASCSNQHSVTDTIAVRDWAGRTQARSWTRPD